MELVNRSLQGFRALSNDPMLGPYQQQELDEGIDEYEPNNEQPQQNDNGLVTLGPTADIVIDFENGEAIQSPPLSGPQSQEEITTFRGNEPINGLELVDHAYNKALENIISIFLYGVVKWNTVSGFLLMVTIFSLKLNISSLYVPLILCFVDIYSFLNLLQNIPTASASEKRRHQLNILQNLLSVISKMALVFYVYLQNFVLVYAFAPTLIFDTLYAIVLSIKYRNHSLKWFYTFQLVFKICYMFLIGCITLRADNLINWHWREVFVGFWMFYAVMAGFTLVAILAFFDKFLNFFLPERRNHELYGLLWLVLVGVGTCIFSAFSIIKLQKVLDNKQDLENLLIPFIVTIIYNMGTVLYTTSHFLKIKMFFDKLFVLEEELDENSMQQNNQQDSEKPKQLNSPTKLVIPRFLAKSSNTYFRRVTQDDIDKTKKKLKSVSSPKSKSKKQKHTKSHQRKCSMDSIQVKKDFNTGDAFNPGMTDLATVLETNRDNLKTDRTIPNNTLANNPKQRMRPLNLGRRLPEFGSFGSQMSDRSRAGLISTQRTTVNFGEITGFHDETANGGMSTRRENEEKIPSVILDIQAAAAAAQNFNARTPEEEPQTNSLNQIPEEENHENSFKYIKRRGNSMHLAAGTYFPGINETFETSSNMEASKLENLETVTSPGIEQSTAQQCLICFDKPTDAVFMECGHGGVCYECSLEIWKTTAECFLCRKKITQVLQIDSKQKIGKNIIKVISATQMVLGQEQA